MKISTKIAALVIAASLPAQAFAENFKRITKEADYVQMVAGKKIGLDATTWTLVDADGTFEGMHKGKTVRGAWKWSGKFWCRNAVVDGKEIGTDCQIVKVSESGVQNTRNKGKGETVYNVFME